MNGGNKSVTCQYSSSLLCFHVPFEVTAGCRNFFWIKSLLLSTWRRKAWTISNVITIRLLWLFQFYKEQNTNLGDQHKQQTQWTNQNSKQIHVIRTKSAKELLSKMASLFFIEYDTIQMNTITSWEQHTRWWLKCCRWWGRAFKLAKT